MKEYSKEVRYGVIDRVDNQYERALHEYCRVKRKTIEELNQEDRVEIWQCAGAHIGLFITWIIDNHFEGTIHKDIPEILEKVRIGEVLGTDFVLKYCDGKFWGEDISDDIFDFVHTYYQKQYLRDYAQWVVEELYDLPLEFVATWKDYQSFKCVVDQAYQSYLENLTFSV